MPPVLLPPITPSTSSTPFDSFVSELGSINQRINPSNNQSNNLSNIQCNSQTVNPHHAIMDTARLINDLILTAGEVFIDQPINQTSKQTNNQSNNQTLAGLSLTGSLNQSVSQSINLRLMQLRDREAISPAMNQSINQLQSINQWICESSSRAINQSIIQSVIQSMYQLALSFSDCYKLATAPSSNPTNKDFIRTPETDLSANAMSAIQSNNQSNSQSHNESVKHYMPLWNTQQLDMQKTEEQLIELVDRLAAERDEAIKSQKKPKKGVEESKEEDDQTNKQSSNQSINQPIAPHQSINFHCAVCDHKLIDRTSIDKVTGNFVWTKSSNQANNQSVILMPYDTWSSCDSGIDQSVRQSDEESNEDAETNQSNKQPLTQPANQIESCAIHCACCLSYVGRNYQSINQSRFVYINHFTGKNWMYFTANLGRSLTQTIKQSNNQSNKQSDEKPTDDETNSAVNKLPVNQSINQLNKEVDDQSINALLDIFPPLVNPSNEEATEDTNNQDEEDEESNDQANKQSTVPVIEPVVGLPYSYQSINQSINYPFPRLPLCKLIADRTNQSNNQIFTADEALTVFVLYPDPMYVLNNQSVNQSNNSSPQSSKQLVNQSIKQPISLLLKNDAKFVHRLMMNLLTKRVSDLFEGFANNPSINPSISQTDDNPAKVYLIPQKSPIPYFTHFFLNPPEFTHSRGTARYLFHFFTQKDDSQTKRVPFSQKKIFDFFGKNEGGVIFLISGSWTGMRSILIKVGTCYRIFQSNHCLKNPADRYTLLDWINQSNNQSNNQTKTISPWSQNIDELGVRTFLQNFEGAKRGDKKKWENLFCMDKSVANIYTPPQDRFEGSDCQMTLAKLNMQLVRP